MSLRGKEATKPPAKSLRVKEATKPPAKSLRVKEATKPPAKSLRVKEAMMSLARSLTVEEALDLLSKVWPGNEMKATVRHTRNAIAVTGFLMAIGGLAIGPPGLAVGGAVGGLIGAYMSWGKFKSVPQMLKELPPAEKEKLRCQVSDILTDLKWTDIKELTKQVMANKAVQEKLLKLTLSFVTHKMGNA
ncbi:protein C19orf12 homolog [Eptesicus fuscus]|uniref:protein C19orf12 homolog n=1 Tax=Eptesicus fuscus TaxID=29078 RepID=UPI002403DF56|nr:protein C19orf12 homolog [Eptesicus fuscus]